MLGYVTINKDELKIREYNVYQGYYCGICKSVGDRLGQTPRMVLSHDAVFLALILGSLDDKRDEIRRERCLVHPLKKRPAARGSEAIDYAADMMILLAYYKFDDDWKDERSVKGLGGKAILARSHGELRRKYGKICQSVENALEKLSALERSKSGSLDKTADAFADIMEAMFCGFYKDRDVNRILAQFGRNLGKWLYVIDAVDDYMSDMGKKRYNPLIYRKNGVEKTDVLLYNYLGEAMKAYDLLEIKKNRGLIENILLMGLRSRTDGVLKERIKKIDERSI